MNNFKFEPEPLGEGKYGRVYRAESVIDKMWYAIKILKPMTLDDCQKAMGECRRLAQLTHHQNIIGYMTSWVEEQMEKEEKGRRRKWTL